MSDSVPFPTLALDGGWTAGTLCNCPPFSVRGDRRPRSGACAPVLQAPGSDFDCNGCISAMCVAGGVLPRFNRKEAPSLCPVEAACLGRVRGAVPGIRRLDDGKSGLPQPPVVSPRGRYVAWRVLCSGRVHSRDSRGGTPRLAMRSSRGGVHLSDATGRGHIVPQRPPLGRHRLSTWGRWWIDCVNTLHIGATRTKKSKDWSAAEMPWAFWSPENVKIRTKYDSRQRISRLSPR